MVTGPPGFAIRIPPMLRLLPMLTVLAAVTVASQTSASAPPGTALLTHEPALLRLVVLLALMKSTASSRWGTIAAAAAMVAISSGRCRRRFSDGLLPDFPPR